MTTGDTITLQFGSLTGATENSVIISLKNMVVAASYIKGANFTFDPKSQTIEYGGNQYNLTGIITDLGKVLMEFKIGGFYDEIGGKFSKVYGNVAIVDCKYLAD